MKVVIMMRDREFRDAFAEMVSENGRDIYAIVNGSTGTHKEAVILTDIMPHELEDEAIEKLKSRTLFLSSVPVRKDHDVRCHVIFKYSGMTSIISELASVYAEWTGDSGSLAASTRVIAVLSEADQLCAERCRTLAAQIIYNHGDSVLIIPMGYINGHIQKTHPDEGGAFRRMMYMIDEGRDYRPESFTECDSYGISYMRLPAGINPVSGLDEDFLIRLIGSAGSHFDTVILDIGSCFRSENLKMISRADNIIFFGNGRNIGDISEYTGVKAAERIRKIDSADTKDETIEIDDYVKEIYGESFKKGDST